MSKRQNKMDALVIPRRGPQERRGGAGVHGDRRTKRLRTRGAQKRAAVREAW